MSPTQAARPGLGLFSAQTAGGRSRVVMTRTSLMRFVILASLVIAACGGRTESDRSGRDPVDVDRVPAPPAAVLPAAAGALGPAHTIAAAGEGTRGEHLGDVETCGRCHEAVAEQWRASAHAFSSFSNPIYRVSVDAIRAEVGNKESRFCAGCHDVALLVDGAMDHEVAADDPRAHAGITCRTCHGVTGVTSDGNGSYHMRGDPIPLPADGDAASVERHKQAVNRDALGFKLCGSCHRSFLDDTTGNPHALGGQNELGTWRSSAFAGNGLARIDSGVDERDCAGCHMQRERSGLLDPSADARGRVASHRFLGGHTWLASMRRDPETLARVQAFLEGSVSVDIAAARVDGGAVTYGADGLALPADGGDVILTVAVRNLRVGHQFPAGVRDAQDVWIEVEARDRSGAVIAAAGTYHREVEDDPSAHVFRAHLADDDGALRLDRATHRFRALVIDHTIAPRDTAVVEYRLPLAKGVGQVRVEARVLHRSRNLELQKRTCAAHETALGAAMAAGSKVTRGAALDPCPAQPITVIARDQAVLGAGAAAVADPRPRWRRLYELGAGLAHSVQEDLDRARAPLLLALAELEPVGGGWQRAALLAELADIAGRQGRTADALALLARAETDAAGHPTLATIRGEALTRVWRWQEAVEPLEYAASRAPGNTGAWIRLAIALGSAGRDAEALVAAQTGLAMAPRQPDLLRVQALSLRALGAPHDAALSAYDRYKSPDAAPHLRIKCAQRSFDCNRERDPVHIHDMIPR